MSVGPKMDMEFASEITRVRFAPIIRGSEMDE